MPGLVYIGRVVLIEPIAAADRIERLEVDCGKGGRWSGCAQKGQFKVDDSCQVYLQDSLLPQTPEFAFMEKHHWRVKMMRFLGVPSEALIFPQTLPGTIGDDVTDLAGVSKYEKPIPASIGGEIMGNFPAGIPKTDEPNYQSVPELVQWLVGKPWVATQKVDGTSTTVFWNGERFGVCSRNWELKDTPQNAAWQIVRQYNLETVLRASGLLLALQWETVGPGIQSNPLGLKKIEPRLFNVWDISNRQYFDHMTVEDLNGDLLGLPLVQEVADGLSFNPDANYLRKLAEGTYPNGRQQEGIVIRPQQEARVDGVRVSFKVINLLYKD